MIQQRIPFPGKTFFFLQKIESKAFMHVHGSIHACSQQYTCIFMIVYVHVNDCMQACSWHYTFMFIAGCMHANDSIQACTQQYTCILIEVFFTCTKRKKQLKFPTVSIQEKQVWFMQYAWMEYCTALERSFSHMLEQGWT